MIYRVSILMLMAMAVGAAAMPTSDREAIDGLLYFHASWSPECKAAKPIMDRLYEEGFAVWSVDTDRQPELAAKYRVAHVPVVVRMVAGSEKGRLIGSVSEAQVRALLWRSATPWQPAKPAKPGST